MNSAKRIYRRNVIIGISVGLFLLLYCVQDWSYYLGGVFPKLFDNDPEFAVDVGEVVWPIILMILYGIYAGIRRLMGKEAGYYGRLRILPIIYMCYLLLNSLLVIFKYS